MLRLRRHLTCDLLFSLFCSYCSWSCAWSTSLTRIRLWDWRRIWCRVFSLLFIIIEFISCKRIIFYSFIWFDRIFVSSSSKTWICWSSCLTTLQLILNLLGASALSCNVSHAEIRNTRVCRIIHNTRRLTNNLIHVSLLRSWFGNIRRRLRRKIRIYLLISLLLVLITWKLLGYFLLSQKFFLLLSSDFFSRHLRLLRILNFCALDLFFLFLHQKLLLLSLQFTLFNLILFFYSLLKIYFSFSLLQ